MKKIILLSLLFSLLASCGVKQEIKLFTNGSAKINLNIVLDGSFMQYLYDLAEATSNIKSKEELEIFNIPEIKKNLEAQPGLKVEQIKSATKDALSITLLCTDIDLFSRSITAGFDKKLILYTKTANSKEVKFFLDKSNYSNIRKLFTFLENPVFENLAPQENDNLTEAEYLDIIEFAMESAGKKAAIASYIEVKVDVEGTILSQKGGILNNNSVSYKIPLVKVLVLKDPLEFSIQYK